ncbi:MAG: hypothetical protein PHF37_05270 [Phycisphaerae bacterium]|nr:hypothetical protein [Phycisphaerae bacterium]
MVSKIRIVVVVLMLCVLNNMALCGLDENSEAVKPNLLSEERGTAKMFIVDQEFVINKDTIIDSQNPLFVYPPGIIKVSKGVTLTIEGIIQSGPYKIFEGEGNIIIKNRNDIYVDWWGEDGTAIQKAINSVDSGRILLLEKQYDIQKSIKGKRGVIIQGKQSHELWTEDTGTVLNYTGKENEPVLDFRGARIFGVRDLKILGRDIASHGIITGHRGIETRAKNSTIENLVIFNCGVGVDMGETDDVFLTKVVFLHCNVGLRGTHTHVGVYDCSFIHSKRAGVEIATSSKGAFYRCLWTENNVDIMLTCNPHPGSVYAFRDCWFENCKDSIIKKAPEIKDEIGLLTWVFDECHMHSFGKSFMDFSGFGKYQSRVVFNNCQICPTTSSWDIYDPNGAVEVVYNPDNGLKKTK